MSYIDDVFQPGGYLALQVPGYAQREPQIDMADECDHAFETGARLLIEAPTGVGKSVGYLVPAIYRAVHHAQRAVIVTSGIALQEQLIKKDLPALQRALPWKFEFAMLKGVSNYLCNLELENATLDPSSPREVADVAEWAMTTKTGDLSEYRRELPMVARSKVTTSSEDCLGARCPSAQDCHLLRARRHAAASQVVVVNYHLFFADLALRREFGKGVIPDYANAVLDEVHGAVEICRTYFGSRVTWGGVRMTARRVFRVDASAAQRLESTADRFFADLKRYHDSDVYRARLIEKAPVDWEPLWQALHMASKPMTDQAANTDDPSAAQKLRGVAQTLDRYAAELQQAMTLLDPAFVYYLEEEPKMEKPVALCGAPLDLSSKLREWLWAHPAVNSVVGTSATLATSGGNFSMVQRELGADAARTIEVQAVFDWPKNAILVVPTNMPQPTDVKRFPAAAGDALVDIVQAANGRTLGLFTSNRILNEVARVMRAAMLPYTILVQGEAPRTQLIDQFRDDVHSVLLGTNSFWEGVDVQGESCSVVVIDRLPFDNPDDPVASALEARRKDYFKAVMLPRAVIKFRQGAGRLLRTTGDRGAVVVLDRRLIEKPYGAAFRKGLPTGVRLVKEPNWAAQITEFLK